MTSDSTVKTETGIHGQEDSRISDSTVKTETGINWQEDSRIRMQREMGKTWLKKNKK